MNLLIKNFCRVFFIGFISCVVACSSGGASTEEDEGDEEEEEEENGGTPSSLEDVNDWLYWIDGPDVTEIVASDFDLVVMDYSNDGSEEGEFLEDDISSIQESGKIVLAYMSIGEAEDYRYYFDPAWIDEDGNLTDEAPDFMDEANPDWPGNYKVRYWESDWQDIIFGTTDGDNESYLDRIISAGFDGIYLDIIDAFEYFGPDGEVPERPTAGEDMIDFVMAIAEYARTTRGVEDFLVFPQNGAPILDEDGADEYLSTVDGIGAEDTFYFGEDTENDSDLDLDHAAEVTPYLDQFVEEGKVVLAIDYVQDADKVADFYERAFDSGYIPYAGVRDLDELIVNDGFEPD